MSLNCKNQDKEKEINKEKEEYKLNVLIAGKVISDLFHNYWSKEKSMNEILIDVVDNAEINFTGFMPGGSNLCNEKMSEYLINKNGESLEDQIIIQCDKYDPNPEDFEKFIYFLELRRALLKSIVHKETSDIKNDSRISVDISDTIIPLPRLGAWLTLIPISELCLLEITEEEMETILKAFLVLKRNDLKFNSSN